MGYATRYIHKPEGYDKRKMDTHLIIHVEDDEMQRQLVKKWLDIMGLQSQSYENIDSFYNADIKNASCFVFDWELPDGTGFDLLKNLREQGNNTPVLFATLRDSEADIVSALEAGADDYVAKPIRQHEFSARLNAILRRVDLIENPPESHIQEYGPYHVDMENEQISLDEEIIPLTNKEFLMAVYFFRHKDEIISREDIMKKIWKKSLDFNSRTIDTHISRIRTKLKLDGENGWKLFSIYLHGYRLRHIKKDSN